MEHLEKRSDFYFIPNSKSYQLTISNHISVTGKEYGVAQHYWEAHDSKKVVVTATGYLESAGYFLPLHQWLLERGFSIICIELPGHGCSSGERADIDSFHSYKKIFKEILESVKENHSDVSFIGHSTGVVGLFDNLLSGENFGLDKIIFLSPLIRSNFWSFSKVGILALGNFLSKVPRAHPPISKTYSDIIKRDPDYLKEVSLHWVKELIAWNNSLDLKNKKISDRISVLFGAKDSVLSLKYCQRIYRRLVGAESVSILKGFEHRFFFYDKKKNQIFFDWLEKEIV